MKLLIPPPVLLLIAAGLMWAVSEVVPAAAFTFDYQFRVAFFIVAIAISIDIAAIGLFRRRKTTVNPINPDKTSALVTDGIYKYTRNPMYLGMVLILTGFGIWLGNVISFLVIPLFAWCMTHFQIKPEEAILREKFGAEFQTYCKTVRRWI